MEKIREVGLGAGMARRAADIEELALDSVSVVELGSFTLNESKGNNDPTSHWDEETETGHNAIGLKNDGVKSFCENDAPQIARLFASKLAKTDLSLAPKEPGDLEKSIKLLTPLHGVLPIRYLVVNGACPNKWKSGTQQPITARDPAATRTLLQEAADSPYDVMYKIAPDTPDNILLQIVDICYELGVKGLISGNTRGVKTPLGAAGKPVVSMPNSGMSGKPLLEDAIDQVARLRKIIDAKGYNMRLTGMGGLLKPEDGIRMFEAGADEIKVASLFYFCGGWKATTKFATAVNLG